MPAKAKKSLSFDAIRRGLAPLYQQPIYQWAEENVSLPNAYAREGKFSSADVPFIREPLDALLDPGIREVVCMSGVQCLKTLIGELWTLYSIVENPGPFQWLQPTDPEAKQHAEERFDDLVLNCRPVASLYSSDRYKVKRDYRKFQNGMYVRFQGAENLKNLQRKSIKLQFCSEVWTWKPGRLAEAAKRMTQFRNNRKRYVESQAGFVDDDMDERFKLGTQEILHIKCAKCGKAQPLKWTAHREDHSRAGIVWAPEAKSKDGSYDFGIIEQSIGYACVHCGHVHEDKPLVRRKLLDTVHYVASNPKAPSWIRSFSWNQLIAISIPWADLAREWIDAINANRAGNDKLLTQFIQKVCAEPYDPSSFTEHEKPATYEVSDSKWPDERGRFLTVDVQDEEVFWFVVRAWGKGGASRLLEAGEAIGIQEIVDAQERHKVPSQNVGIDSGNFTRDVYGYCVRYGWKAMKGEDTRRNFSYVDKRTRKKVLLPYKLPFAQGYPAIGRKVPTEGRKFCPIIVWCNFPIKEILFRLRDGRGGEWLAPENVSTDWVKHLRSERKIRYFDSSTGYTRERYEVIGRRPNHLLDAEAMQVTLAYIAGLLS